MVLLCALTQVTLSIRIYKEWKEPSNFGWRVNSVRGGAETFNRTEMDFESS